MLTFKASPGEAESLRAGLPCHASVLGAIDLKLELGLTLAFRDVLALESWMFLQTGTFVWEQLA